MLESDPPRNAGVFMRRKPALTALHRFRLPPASHDHSDDTLRSVEDRISSYLQLPTNVFDRLHSTHESNMIFRRLRPLHSIDVVWRNDDGRQDDGGTVQ
ncbi:hypothetical protein DFH07DRAFT_970708 [Mycena maculata]|uniref:Uncharacterized protein n=1 Tax=Mycena maculata TaxID=230809 RepID=A0AAD7HQJ4_9AGAR|nr:hypothetical protein DFH07DRAFT_970708 [Mycena maculata]